MRVGYVGRVAHVPEILAAAEDEGRFVLGYHRVDGGDELVIPRPEEDGRAERAGGEARVGAGGVVVLVVGGEDEGFGAGFGFAVDEGLGGKGAVGFVDVAVGVVEVIDYCCAGAGVDEG